MQVLVVHGLNHLEFTGPLVDALKLFPGVPIFFFVSGMLITSAYERVEAEGGGLKKFFINRVLRIYPALWLCVLISIIAVYATGYFAGREISPLHFTAWVFGQAGFLQFYNPEFMRGFGVGVLNGALWTISVELQFYVLAPVLCFILRRRLKLFLLLLVVSVLANVYLRLFYDWSDMRIKLLAVSFLPWIYMFMTGALAYRYRTQLKAWGLPSKAVWMLGLYVASMLLIGPYEHNASNGINPLSFLLLAGLIFWLSEAAIPLPQKVAGFVRRNDLSYGIYLYHTPLLNVVIYTGFLHGYAHAQLATVLLLPLGLALISWFVVERPALDLKNRF